MKITTLSGHLTVTNRKHIKEILKRNMQQAKVNRIGYFLIVENDIYTVKIIQKDNSILFGEKVQKSKATFKLN